MSLWIWPIIIVVLTCLCALRLGAFFDAKDYPED